MDVGLDRKIPKLPALLRNHCMRAARGACVHTDLSFHRCLLSLGIVESPTRGCPKIPGGTSTGFFLFFITIARLSWINAMNDLYSQAGLVRSRAFAPINVLDEVRAHNLVLVSWEVFRLRADIIEFIDE